MHCPKCDYDLSVAIHRQCSECGHVVTEHEVEIASGLGANPRTEQWRLLSMVFLFASIGLFALISLARLDARFVLCSVLAVGGTVAAGRLASMKHPTAMRRGATRHWIMTAGWVHFPFILGPLFAIGADPVRDLLSGGIGLSNYASEAIIYTVVGWLIGLLIALPIHRRAAVFAHANGAAWYRAVLLVTAILNGLFGLFIVTRWAGL